jgi:hypothetical protein
MFSISVSVSFRNCCRNVPVRALALASGSGSRGLQEPTGKQDSSSSSSSSSAAASLDSSAALEGSNKSHGFGRPEMYKSALVGSVDHYERHLFLCYKDASSWPAKVEAADYDPLPHSLVTALKTRRSEIPVKVNPS